MKSIATAVAFAVLASAAHAGTDSRCYVPSFLTEPGAALKRVTESVKRDKKLSIVLISGSPSQTGGTKGLRSYPTYLESTLRERLPGVEVKVEVRAKARQPIHELVPLLPALLDETKPALVVWQMGTVDTLRQTDVESFGQNLRRGMAAIAKGGSDSVLIDMQYSPRTDRLVDYTAYLAEIRDGSDAANVPLFDRYEIMRYWNVAGNFDLSSLKDDGLYEKIHVCIGSLLADFILRGAGLREDKGFGG
jgi:hypothetical protein